MPSIYLKQTGPYGTVTVAPERYTPSNLFTKYKHTFIPSITGIIRIFNYKYNDFRIFHNNGFQKYLNLTTNNGDSSSQLTEAHVYVNKHDPKRTPLLFVLIFNNGGPKLEKYYKASDFKSKIESKETVGISQLTKYTDEKSILKDLITENDSLQNILTYDIGRTKSDNGNGNYNGGKIKLTEDESDSEPNLSENGFRLYKHTPANGDNGGKKACVIYDGNVLLKKDGKQEISEIQNQQYECINVYMGEKAKKTSVVSGSEIDVPLLIELNKKNGSNEPEYYVHKRNTSGYYWEKLLCDNGSTTLEDLLTDMGFSTTKGQPGYQQLKTLLSTPGVLNGQGDSDLGDLSTKLKDVKGTKLQNLLKEKVGESGSAKPTLLVLLLRQIEFNIVDSVIVLLEKRDSDGSTYDEGQVSTVVKQLDPKRDINRVKMNNGTGKKITVSDKTDNNGKGTCVQTYKYKVYEHDFSTLVSGLDERSQPFVGIRFIIPNGDDKFKQLMLYNGDKAEPQNLDYKYYQKNGGSTTSSDKVYVWFYNGDGTGKGDPRPLMLCYNNTTYAPKNKEKYFTEWVKLDLSNGGPGSLKDCGCPQGQEQLPENNKLLQNLDRVVKFLNTVKLKEGTNRIGTSNDTQKYDVHKFQNKSIQIKVECSFVGGSGSLAGTCSTSTTSCYKKFEHKPIGIQNGPGVGVANNGSGYRLGEVVYNGGGGKPTSTLNYAELNSEHKYDPLVSVTVYYYDKDTKYDDPLLIELEFKKNGGVSGGNEKEYYKLTTSGGSGVTTLKWELDRTAKDKMDSNPVDHLDSIRYDLKKHIKILIDKQRQYDLCLSNQPGGTGNEYKQENGGKKIQVEECQNNGCDKLKSAGYVCYEHKVSEIIGNRFDYNR